MDFEFIYKELMSTKLDFEAYVHSLREPVNASISTSMYSYTNGVLFSIQFLDGYTFEADCSYDGVNTFYAKKMDIDTVNDTDSLLASLFGRLSYTVEFVEENADIPFSEWVERFKKGHN
jgi:hypothetical protein